MKMGRDGCQRDWSALQVLPTAVMLTLFLLILPAVTEGALHWAYIPEPPVLHPAVWSGPQVRVFSSNTELLGLPLAMEQQYVYDNFNFSGSAIGLPICFLFNSTSQSGCLNITEQLWPKKGGAIMLGAPDGKTVSNNDTIPFELCHSKRHVQKDSVWWHRCHQENVTLYRVTGFNETVWDFSRPYDTKTALSAGLWKTSSGAWQTHIWKLAAGLVTMSISMTNESRTNSRSSGSGEKFLYALRTCVNVPYILLLGNFNIFVDNNTNQFNISCNNCQLSNCVTPVNTSVLVLRQPPFIMVPVNLTGPWFDEYGLQVLQEINNSLRRSKRAIAVLVAGVLSLITLVVTAATTAISLSNSIQTAAFVNDLTKNVSLTMGSQENIDEKIEQKLEALYETVNFLGEEMQALKLSSHLRCHVQYRWICVTPQKYNQTSHPWEKIKNHLQGIWHSANMSLDLVQLHREILALKEAPDLQINTAQTVRDFLKGLKSIVPTWGPFTHLLGSVNTLACCMLVFMCLMPLVLKCTIRTLRDLGSEIHSLKLKMKQPPV
ncbi:endogenous retrovirus group K member 13-1 Env polyprotein-like [Pteropus medius]|uniref:endogenous retrovirus group K member 13-1 Env polyprotein-like n=1 Tax=Pteropus vampyrus TaxID=132908 RepID=UPI00196A82A4|nr:endogenous retrovirus group K member 13-1 Env polyprotein-like [Pteropus giganteus]